MAKMLCPLVPCNFAMFCGIIYVIVIMVGTFYFSSIMSSQQQSYTHLQRNNALGYFVENRSVSTDLHNDTKEKDCHIATILPQKQMKISNSSWLAPLCHVQWLLPLLSFCNKHRQLNHTLFMVPTMSMNKIRSEKNTLTKSAQEGKTNNDSGYLSRTRGKYNIIDLPFSRLVPLVYVSTAFIFGVSLIFILVYSLCVCVRSRDNDCNSQCPYSIV